jgi:hypothetical protein
MSEITAYEKMLKDGSAFKKIDMQRIQNQMYEGAGGAVEKPEPSMPLGEPLGEESNLQEDHTDWSAVDEAMQRRMNALKNKARGGGASTKQPLNESQEITKLKARVKRLEEALIIIMETQEKLLG